MCNKDCTSAQLIKFLKRYQNKKSFSVIKITSDRCTEYTNKTLESYMKEQDIHHEYSVFRTLQQNGVAERMNKTLRWVGN